MAEEEQNPIDMRAFNNMSITTKYALDDATPEKINKSKRAVDEYFDILREKDKTKLTNFFKTKFKIDNLDNYPMLTSIIDDLDKITDNMLNNDKELMDSLFKERQIEVHDEEHVELDE